MEVFCENLESTDAALEEPYPRPTRPDTAMRERRRCPRPATCLFFFFSRLAPTLLRLGPIRAESGRLRPYRAKRPIQAMAEAKPAWQRRRLLLLRFVRLFFFFSFLRFVRPFQLYFKFSLPCFMFVNLAREWMLEMIKRFDKTLFLRATRNI